MFKFLKENKIYLTITICCLLVMLISILAETNIFIIIKEYILNSDYRARVSVGESNASNIFELIWYTISSFQWTYDYMIIWGTNIFQILLPFLGLIGGIIFFKKNKSINQFTIHKSKKYGKFLLRNILIISLKIALSVMIAYFLFYIFSLILSHGNSNTSISRSIFLDWFGEKFYYTHTQLYYLLDGIVRFCIAPFIYCFFACAISLKVSNMRQLFFYLACYYFGLEFISFGVLHILGPIGIYFSPMLIMVSGAYSEVNTLAIFLTNLIPIIISFLILREVKNNVEI